MLTQGKKIWGIKDPTGQWIKDDNGLLIRKYDDYNLAKAECDSLNDSGTPMCTVCVISEGEARPPWGDVETKYRDGKYIPPKIDKASDKSLNS